MPLDRLLRPGLLRTLLSRNLLLSVVPLVLLLSGALYVSNTLIATRFEDEAKVLADTANRNIDDKVSFTTRSANLIAQLPTTRELTQSRDSRGLVEFLLPLKSRISVDYMDVADMKGNIIAGAQDTPPGAMLKSELADRAGAAVEQSWVLYDEPPGITVRAIALIRGQQQEPIGMLEIGVVLGQDFLKTVKTRSDTHVLLAWDGAVKASTIPIADASIVPLLDEVDATRTDTLVRNVRVGDESYYGVFSVVRSHAPKPGLLGVLVPLAPMENAQRTLIGFMVLAAVGLSLLVGFVAYRSAREITNPLASLADAAQRIEAGDFAVRIEQRSAHEIGTLEHAFDTMARSLQERERGLQEYLAEARSVNAVADAVVGVTDRERIFAESLGRVVALLGAAAAAIVLREDAAGSPADSGGKLTPATTIGIDSGTAMLLAARVLVAGRNDPNVVQRASVQSVERLASGVHVPLGARGRTVGLLSAYFSDERDIGDSEARTLRTIARLVSVAKENAELVTELRENNFQLERANRLKSEFLASVSHELRTPMNAIIGYTKLMLDGLDGALSEQQEADLKRVAQAADNLLGLINGILDLAKIEAGRMEIHPEEVALQPLASEVIELVRPAADAKHIELRSTVAASLPALWVDRARTRQILLNLMANAVKFTERGSVSIQASATTEWMTISVVDTGIGITPEAQAYIFDEFRQADSSTTRKYGGTGLGLAISKRLVVLHGGRIWVESAPGAGSAFRFTVPVRVESHAPAIAS